MDKVCLSVVLIAAMSTVDSAGITAPDIEDYCVRDGEGGVVVSLCQLKCEFENDGSVYFVTWYSRGQTDTETGAYTYNTHNMVGQHVLYFHTPYTNQWLSPGTFRVNDTHEIAANYTTVTLRVHVDSANRSYDGVYTCGVAAYQLINSSYEFTTKYYHHYMGESKTEIIVEPPKIEYLYVFLVLFIISLVVLAVVISVFIIIQKKKKRQWSVKRLAESEEDGYATIFQMTELSTEAIYEEIDLENTCVEYPREKVRMKTKTDARRKIERWSATVFVIKDRPGRTDISVRKVANRIMLEKNADETANISRDVAAAKKSLRNELEILKKVPLNTNIVELLGACTKQGPLFLLTERSTFGNLKTLLTPGASIRDSTGGGGQGNPLYANVARKFGKTLMMKCMLDVANGANHLSRLEIAHCNLNATTVFVFAGDVFKIGDFEFAVDISNGATQHPMASALSVRRLPPETIDREIVSAMTDVWSYGVLLWEILTEGAEPYDDVGNDINVWREINKGTRLHKPHNCSPKLFVLMMQCWCNEPESRPKFQNIIDDLRMLCKEMNRYSLPPMEDSDVLCKETNRYSLPPMGDNEYETPVSISDALSTTAAVLLPVAISTAVVAPPKAAVAPPTAAVAPPTAAVAPTTAAVAPSTAAVAPTTAAVAPTTAAVATSSTA